MILSLAIKNRIYELCKVRNLTLNKLCTICGITQSTLSNINLSVLTVMRICRGLNISLLDFFNSPLFDINKLDDD